MRVAAPFAGSLSGLPVQRSAQVKVGDPLFVLEQENEKAARVEAGERLRRAEAQLENLRKGKRPDELAAIASQQDQAAAALNLSGRNLKRQEKLLAAGAITHERLDEARSAYDRDRARVAELAAQARSARLGGRSDEIAAAVAEVEAGRAVLAQAQWKLAQKSVTSPVTGRIDDTLYTLGEWVAAGNPVVSILPPQNIKVRFFVSETLLASVREGQAVAISCDGCGTEISAKISFISRQAEYTPPVIYSKESRAKLVYLVEAVPAAADAIKIHPGQPLDVRLK